MGMSYYVYVQICCLSDVYFYLFIRDREKKKYRYNIYSVKSLQIGRIIIRVYQFRFLIWFISKRYKIIIIDLDKIFLII